MGVEQVDLIEIRERANVLAYVAPDAFEIVDHLNILRLTTAELWVALQPSLDDQIGHCDGAGVGLQDECAVRYADEQVCVKPLIDGQLLMGEDPQTNFVAFTSPLEGRAEQFAVHPVERLVKLTGERFRRQPALGGERDKVGFQT